MHTTGTYLDQLACDIDACVYQLKSIELMTWGNEDLLGKMGAILAGPEFTAGMQVHCKVSLGSVFKQGPLYDRIRHIRPDYLVTNHARAPIAFIDYQGGGHDAAQDAVKGAVARRAGLAFIQIPREYTFGEVRQTLLQALMLTRVTATRQDAAMLHEVLERAAFKEIARAA